VLGLKKLAPVSFDPDPAAAAMGPVTFDPTGVGMRRFDVGAGNPGVALTVPAVVAGVPSPFTMLRWRRRNDFMRTLRWTDANNDLGLGNTSSEEKSTGNNREELLCAISLCCG
jgi:hypothetical protein